MIDTSPATRAAYYGRADLLGRLLSWWRTRTVLPHVKGELIDLACGDNRLVRAVGRGVRVDVRREGAADLIVERLDRLPFADHTVDTVTIIASLNYFDDPAHVLKEVARILRHDGVLITTMTSPMISAWWHRIREPWARCHGFSHAEMMDLLAYGGFVLVGKTRFMCGLNAVYIAHKRSPAMRTAGR